jgi:tetratricopeptide (TPR) repeat protein
LAVLFKEEKRNVIPRWRSFGDTLLLGELSSLPGDGPKHVDHDFLLEKRRAWEINRTAWHAADLLGCGVSLGREPEIKDAAQFLIRDGTAPFPVRRIAERVLSGAGKAVPALIVPSEDEQETRFSIREKRRVLSIDPRNALAWVDLARNYTVLGLTDRAERAMSVALGLNRSNRFILRSAARFYIHRGEADRAHELIRKAPSGRHDPWLLAAEIAVASATGTSSRFAIDGRKVLDAGSFHPIETTELASALGTLEHSYGKHRNAKKLFREALTSPNDNSLAQVQWASKRIAGLAVRVDDYHVPFTFEAKALQSFRDGSWMAALDSGRAWLADQPFSSTSAGLSSYIASSIFEDYKLSVRLLEVGLLSNPRDPLLLNNLAFSLASLGDIEGAQRAINKIDVETLDTLESITVRATQGLILYRRGQHAEGRRKYLEAIEIARQNSRQETAVEAMIFLAREELLATPTTGIGAADAAMKAADTVENPGKHIRQLVENLKARLRFREANQRVSTGT